MRASATSRLATPAHLPAARADTNTAKADDASPFALLVGAAVPPAQKAGHAPGDHSEDKPDQDKAHADPSAPAQTAAQPQQTTKAANTSQPAAQPADADGQDHDTKDDDSQTVDGALPAQDPDPAVVVAAPLATTADSDAVDESSQDQTVEDQAVALWPQSARTNSQADQKPAKAEKNDKKQAQDQQPDASIQPAPAQPPADLQPVAVAAIAAPPAPIAPTSAPPPASDAIAPAIQPAGPPAAQAGVAAAGQTPPASAGPADPESADDAGTVQDPTIAANNLPAPAAGKNQPKAAAPKPAASDKLANTAGANAADKSQQAADPATVKAADAPVVHNDGDDSKPDAAKPTVPATDVTAAKTLVDTITLPVVAQPAAPQVQAPATTQHIQVTAQGQAANLPALAVEIAAKSQSGAKQFDIRLDPPELGRVEVRLSIDATGKASAHLSADQPQTLSLLQKDAPALTRALRDAGLDVSQNGLNFSLRQQASHDGGARAGSGRGSSRGFSLTATTSIDATPTSAAYYGRGDGRLDIRV